MVKNSLTASIEKEAVTVCARRNGVDSKISTYILSESRR